MVPYSIGASFYRFQLHDMIAEIENKTCVHGNAHFEHFQLKAKRQEDRGRKDVRLDAGLSASADFSAAFFPGL